MIPGVMHGLMGGGGPRVVDAVTRLDSSGSTHTPDLSAFSAGDLIVGFALASASASRTINTPSGWTSLYNATGTARLRAWAGFYRFMSGSEGGSLSFSYGGGTAGLYSFITISGASEVSGGIASSKALGASSVTPPELVAASVLWLTAVHADNNLTGTGGPYTPPSGYTTETSGASSAFAGIRQEVASRRASASSEAPGAWAFGQTIDQSVASLVGVT